MGNFLIGPQLFYFHAVCGPIDLDLSLHFCQHPPPPPPFIIPPLNLGIWPKRPNHYLIDTRITIRNGRVDKVVHEYKNGYYMITKTS